jgi:hypothetical protein
VDIVIVFTWLPAGGRRHAVACDLAGNPITDQTLAGTTITLPGRKPTAAEWLWPECIACQLVARADGAHYSTAKLRAVS